MTRRRQGGDQRRTSMKLIALLVCAALACTAAAQTGAQPATVTATPPATAPVKALTPQRERMQHCNAEANAQQLKGDARKAFMSSCLKAS
jgi:hypothetical protein